MHHFVSRHIRFGRSVIHESALERGFANSIQAIHADLVYSGTTATRRHEEAVAHALRDTRGCAVGCYIWVKHLPILVDVMVLGNFLREHGLEATEFLCINGDTKENVISSIPKALRGSVPVTDSGIPGQQRGSEQHRLQGVYSELQTMNMFAAGR